MIRPQRWILPLGLAVVVWSTTAWAQIQRTTPGQFPGTGGTAQGQSTGPLRAPMTLTPSIGFLEEYNDNIFFDNANKQWDFITSIVPGVAFAIENPEYHLLAAYNFTARLYARRPDRDTAFDRQDFRLDGLYRFNPQFGVSLEDNLRFTTGLNVLSAEGVATGFDKSLSNTLRPGATLELDPLTSVRSFASWTLQRYQRDGLRDSDVYRIEADIERRLSTRLRGTLGYEFAYFAIEQVPNVTSHTPRIGLTYELTQTLSASVVGGPTFWHIEDDGNHITPQATGRLTQRFDFGSVAVGYDRRINTAGALGVVADSQTIFTNVTLIKLAKGLSVEVSPYYRILKSPDNSVDIRAYGVPVQATWQFTPWFGVTAGYIFFHQRSDSTVVNTVTGAPLATDVDQNRVYFGFLFGYPIKFD